MRPAKACRQCRSSKRKCVKGAGTQTTACRPCQQRSLDCSIAFTPSKTRSIVVAKKSPVSSLIADSPLSQFVNSLGKTIDYIDLYFRFIHDRPHSLFHRASILAELRAGTISKCLLMAICALGCRFSTNPLDPFMSTYLRRSSSELFAAQLETISLANVQTCILLANIYAADQENELEALYFSIANRMASILRLYETNPEDPPILREVKCRTWWTLFMADRWCPPGLGLSREISGINPSSRFPRDEVAFQNLKEDAQIDVNEHSDGMWKYMITLVDILGPIQDLNQSLVRTDLDRHDADRQVAHLADCLRAWSNSLPDHMIMNDGNFESYQLKGHGGTFVALHLGYHHYCTLLYFQYLDASTQSSPEAAQYAQECRSHALSFSKLLHKAQKRRECYVVYLTVAYMTMVSSSVLLHLLLFGEDGEVETAREQLVHNFKALIELKQYWPNMDRITQRLFDFQNECLRSTSQKTHAMDRWMVRFLLEHALPLGEKGTIENVEVRDEDLSRAKNGIVSAERTNILDQAFANLYK